jgi:hypothetical protein
MKFVRSKQTGWHGNTELPQEINTVQNQQNLAEFELLSVIATLHGISAFDMLTGATEESEKDRDISEVLDAFQAYIIPKMPLSNYNNKEKRKK